MTLAKLRDEFFAARAEQQKRARFSVDACPPRTCRYCGRFWLKWEGSKLDGHAKCSVTERFRFALRQALLDPMVTYEEVAKLLGVSISVIRSWSFPIRGAA